MKIISLLIVCLVGTLSHASATQISGVYQANGNITRTESNCPRGATCIASLYRVELAIQLKGCLDELMSVSTYVTTEPKGKIRLIVSAVGGANLESKSAQCVAAPVAYSTVTLMSAPDDVVFIGAN